MKKEYQIVYCHQTWQQFYYKKYINLVHKKTLIVVQKKTIKMLAQYAIWQNYVNSKELNVNVFKVNYIFIMLILASFEITSGA